MMKASLVVLAVFALGILPGVAKYDGHPPEPPAVPARHHASPKRVQHPVTMAVLLTRIRERLQNS